MQKIIEGPQEKRIQKEDHVLIINRGGPGGNILRKISESIKQDSVIKKNTKVKTLPEMIVCGQKKSFKKWL